MEKHEQKEEYRDSLGQPNPAHDMQLRTIREKEEMDKKAAAEAAKTEEAEPKKAKK